jgi:hypothetical protein
MKKLLSMTFLGLACIFGPTAASAAMSYECWNHPDGKPKQMVKVSANSSSEAVDLAIQKFEALGVSTAGISCK